MKSFDEFLSTLSAEDQQAIMERSFSLAAGDGRRFSADEMRLATSIAAASSAFMCEMLRRYHSWLSAQMN